MHVTADSHGSVVAALVLILGAALAVLGLVHLLTSLQMPDSVPDCGKAEILDAFTHECARVEP